MADKPVGQALLSSVRQRSAALISFVEKPLTPGGAGASAQAEARSQIVTIAQGIAARASHLYERSPDDRIAALQLRPLLAYLAETLRAADQIFGRRADQVPRSLVRAVQRELSRLEATRQIEPLLTIAEPSNYETDTGDLWSTLASAQALPGLKSPRTRVRVFSVPHQEGTHALWTPIAVGHEVGHIVVNETKLLDALEVESWLPTDSIDLDLFGSDVSPWPESVEDVRDAALRILRRWTIETLCDLYAVRRFGPAAVAAQCEFLSAITNDAEAWSATHPPAYMRARVMAASVSDAPAVFEPLIGPWLEWSSTMEPIEESWPRVLVAAIEEHIPEIAAALDTLSGGRYDPASRESAVRQARAWLAQGVPGRERVAGQRLRRADLINAGWLARLDIASPNDLDAVESGRRLQTVDALVTKGLDTIDFLRLWRTAKRSLASGTAADGEANGTGSTAAEEALAVADAESTANRRRRSRGAGVITQKEIRRRLKLGNSADPLNLPVEALVLTPRSSTSIDGASLDVRVGRSFITFRRSATAAFAAIDAAQDPREMQDLVEKDWGGEFVLHPAELVLAATLEYLRVPIDLTAQVITRSSYGRLGLLSATAVQVQPGFTGCLTLELVNLGQMPLTLTPGERVAQLVFSTASPPARVVTAKYRFPTGPEFSRVSSDPDLEILRRMRRRLEISAGK